MKQTTIFRQLVINIIVPVVLALMLLAVLNYYNTKTNFKEANYNKKQIIFKQIQDVMTFQDFTLRIIEQNLEKRIRTTSTEIINKHLINNPNINTINLKNVRAIVGMDSTKEDIYVIDAKTGFVVNTTYEKDRNLNVFTFGVDFKTFLEKVVKQSVFVSERFSYESSTNKIKKYTYQPTPDGNYILEIGIYSAEADSSKKLINKFINTIIQQDAAIKNIELFISANEPFNLNTGEKIKNTDDRYSYLIKAFKNKVDTSFEKSEAGAKLNYDFIYMERQNTTLYKNSIISIISDTTSEYNQLRSEMLKLILVFSFVLILMIIIIYFNTKKIIIPIKKLANNVARITNGDYRERAEVEGNNEITILSEKFNIMISSIESYNTQLEEKVEQRTREIMTQKKEIEKQKTRITDSINYAKYIQDAILPSFRYIKTFIPEMFILFKPRDIVSGDFYWLHHENNKTFLAVIDCTGHGVPGAFMSMVSHTLLNEIIKEKKIYGLNDVLLSLNQGIIKTLNQIECEQDDGMDISICCIDKDSKTFSVAAANQTALVMQNGEQTIITGDPYSIGGLLSHRQKVEFNAHTFKYDASIDTKLYLTSDGFPDQHGWVKDYKFGTGKLMEKLKSISSIPVMMDQMNSLSNELKEWQGDERQTDDILVIGLKIN